MDKQDKQDPSPKKPQPKQSTAPRAPGFPAQNANAGIKRASAGHDRKTVGRGNARGR